MAELSRIPIRLGEGHRLPSAGQQVEGQKRQLVTSWVVMVLAVVVADIVCPLIFASILGRVATLPHHTVAGEWHALRPAAAGLRGGRDRRHGPLAGRRLARVGRLRARLRHRRSTTATGTCSRSATAGTWTTRPGRSSPRSATSHGPSSRWSTSPPGVCCRWSWWCCRPSWCSPSSPGRRPWPCWSWWAGSSSSSPGACRMVRAAAAGVRGPPLQGDRGGGRHGHQPDGGPDRRRRAPRAEPGART